MAMTTMLGDRCQARITNREQESLNLTERKQATTATVFDEMSKATTLLSTVMKQNNTQRWLPINSGLCALVLDLPTEPSTTLLTCKALTPPGS
jgi:nucleoside recognition membrane protein YjiH